MSTDTPDIFGLMRRNRDGQDEIVILKSKSRIYHVDCGMTHEEFEEHWDYNIAGALGLSQYSTIDDEIEIETINEMMNEDEHGIIDPMGDNSEFEERPIK